MTWIKVDDTMPEHPKLVGLSPAAKWMYVEALCYASRNLTDGWVPEALVRRARVARASLVRVGLFVPDEENRGYWIYNYATHQRTRVEVEAQRKQRSEAGHLGAKSRWQKDGEPS